MFERSILIAAVAIAISVMSGTVVNKIQTIGTKITTVTASATNPTIVPCTPKNGSETGCYAPFK